MLTTRQRYLAAITDLWGGIDVSSFSQRLLLQKRLFFAVMLGIDLGYSHSWYIRGPYSPALTRDAFAIDDARKGGTTAVHVSDGLTDKVRSIQKIFDKDWNDPQKMELFASLYYLAKTLKTSDIGVLVDKLRALKGHFTAEEAAAAFIELRERGLVNG